MFASLSAETVPLPFKPPHTATIRKLTGGETDAAQEAHLRATIAGRWVPHGWAESFQRQLTKGLATSADVEQVLRDPLTGYDRHAIVKAGLVAWSVPDRDLSPEAIDDLEDDVLEWFARAILQRTKPALFQTPAEAEDARKNGPGSLSLV